MLYQYEISFKTLHIQFLQFVDRITHTHTHTFNGPLSGTTQVNQ